MQKQTPTVARLTAMVVFALSCFALLLFLWNAFGGPIPLKAKGYRVHVAFDEAVQLAEQADVRIAGVPVGKVVSLRRRGRLTDAELEIEERYAPLPADVRAVLRQKTLLGETFVQLVPGSRDARRVADGGSLDPGRVAPTVELDEILRDFDAPTRRDLRAWIGALAPALDGRGGDVSAALGRLPGAAADGAGLLGVLHAQRDAVQRLVRDSGRVFAAAGRRESATRRLVTAGERVFATTAARDRRLAETIEVLPVFLRELRPTLAELESTSRELGPTVAALRPSAPLVAPTLRDLTILAPDLRAAFARLDSLIEAGRDGLPAAERTLAAARPLLGELHPLGRELVPMVEFIELYRRELVGSWAKVAAATQAATQEPGTGRPLHYLRLVAPTTVEALTMHPERPATNRANPYVAPGGLDYLGAPALRAFDCRNAGGSGGDSTPVLAEAPPCLVQPPILFDGRAESYPNLRRAP